MKSILPLATVLAALIAVWYVAAVLHERAAAARRLRQRRPDRLFDRRARRASLNMERPETAGAASDRRPNSIGSSSRPRRPPSAASSITRGSRWRRR